MTISDKDLRLSRVNIPHTPRHKYPVEKRIEVVTKCLALGNIKLVAELTGVSYGLIRCWRLEPWWKDLEQEILASRRAATDNKLAKIIDRSLEIVQDRLQNGEWAYDKKTGTAFRKEVSLLTANKVANEMLVRQEALAKQAENQTQTQVAESVASQIAHLANEFAKFNTKRTVDVVASQPTSEGETFALHDQRETGLQEGESSLFESSGTNQEQGGEERGQSSDDESWEGTQGGWEGRGPHEASEQGGNQFYEESPHSVTKRQSLFQPE